MENNLTKLPDKWYIKGTNDTIKIINDFINSKGYGGNLSNCDYYIHYPFTSTYGSAYLTPQENYTEITFDQFKKWVLKETDNKPILHYIDKCNDEKEVLVQTNLSQVDACKSCKYTNNCGEAPHKTSQSYCSASGGQHYLKNEVIKTVNPLYKILEEAKKRYPIGTGFKISQERIVFVSDNDHQFDSSGNRILVSTNRGKFNIYDYGNWAEIVSKLEEKWIPKPGDWVVIVSGAGKPNWSPSMDIFIGNCLQLKEYENPEKGYFVIEGNKWTWEYSDRTKHFRKAEPHEIPKEVCNGKQFSNKYLDETHRISPETFQQINENLILATNQAMDFHDYFKEPKTVQINMSETIPENILNSVKQYIETNQQESITNQLLNIKLENY